MKKILIANRGEIASRIIHTCKRLGIETIAIHSEADENMPFVKEADATFLIGPPPVQQSYLKGEEIIRNCYPRRGGRHPSRLWVAVRKRRFCISSDKCRSEIYWTGCYYNF